jgi:hypothetical protein
MTLNLRSVCADAFNMVFRPKRYAASATLPVRGTFHSFFKFIFFSEVSRRAELSKTNTATPQFSIPEKTGFVKMGHLVDQKLKAEVIDACRNLIKEKLTPDYVKKFEKAPFASIHIRENLNPQNPFLKFALQKDLIKSLTNYFGMLPVIENISILYSPNTNNLGGSSQFYHLDGQDVRTVQLFLFIEDVTPDNGPLVVLEAQKSEEIAREIGYRKTKLLKRIDDELVKSRSLPDQIIQATGPSGECYAVDTDRCFHFGSRQATRPRYVVLFQYYTPFAFVLPWRWWKKLPFVKAAENSGFTPLEKAVMGAKA